MVEFERVHAPVLAAPCQAHLQSERLRRGGPGAEAYAEGRQIRPARAQGEAARTLLEGTQQARVEQCLATLTNEAQRIELERLRAHGHAALQLEGARGELDDVDRAGDRLEARPRERQLQIYGQGSERRTHAPAEGDSCLSEAARHLIEVEAVGLEGDLPSEDQRQRPERSRSNSGQVEGGGVRYREFDRERRAHGAGREGDAALQPSPGVAELDCERPVELQGICIDEELSVQREGTDRQASDAPERSEGAQIRRLAFDPEPRRRVRRSDDTIEAYPGPLRFDGGQQTIAAIFIGAERQRRGEGPGAVARPAEQVEEGAQLRAAQRRIGPSAGEARQSWQARRGLEDGIRVDEPRDLDLQQRTGTLSLQADVEGAAGRPLDAEQREQAAEIRARGSDVEFRLLERAQVRDLRLGIEARRAEPSEEFEFQRTVVARTQRRAQIEVADLPRRQAQQAFEITGHGAAQGRFHSRRAYRGRCVHRALGTEFEAFETTFEAEIDRDIGGDDSSPAERAVERQGAAVDAAAQSERGHTVVPRRARDGGDRDSKRRPQRTLVGELEIVDGERAQGDCQGRAGAGILPLTGGPVEAPVRPVLRRAQQPRTHALDLQRVDEESAAQQREQIDASAQALDEDQRRPVIPGRRRHLERFQAGVHVAPETQFQAPELYLTACRLTHQALDARREPVRSRDPGDERCAGEDHHEQRAENDEATPRSQRRMRSRFLHGASGTPAASVFERIGQRGLEIGLEDRHATRLFVRIHEGIRTFADARMLLPEVELLGVRREPDVEFERGQLREGLTVVLDDARILRLGREAIGGDGRGTEQDGTVNGLPVTRLEGPARAAG